jgi:hypothetical protein
MRDRREAFPVRREERDPRRDFWATIRWGAVLGLAIWLIVSAMEMIVTV